MKRYRIEEGTDRVTVHLRTGDAITYWAHGGTGYVHEISEDRPGTTGPQVFDQRAPRGTTLMIGAGGLAATIRRNLTAPCRCHQAWDDDPPHQHVDDLIAERS